MTSDFKICTLYILCQFSCIVCHFTQLPSHIPTSGVSKKFWQVCKNLNKVIHWYAEEVGTEAIIIKHANTNCKENNFLIALQKCTYVQRYKFMQLIQFS